jgi:hypothetical protein
MCTAVVLQDVIWWALYKAEAVLLGSWLRKKALDEVGVCGQPVGVPLPPPSCLFPHPACLGVTYLSVEEPLTVTLLQVWQVRWKSNISKSNQVCKKQFEALDQVC